MGVYNGIWVNGARASGTVEGVFEGDLSKKVAIMLIY